VTVPAELAAPSGESADPRAPLHRLWNLADAGSLTFLDGEDASGVRIAEGRIEGGDAVFYATDGSVMGGAIGSVACGRIVLAIETAVRRGCPVIGVWHSGGARLAEGVQSMDGIGRMFAAMVGASGRIPQISVVVGPAAGGAAYGPALTDLVVMAPAGRVFVTGPDVVRSVTGESVDAEGLGGTDAHGRRSGVVHVVADSEEDAYRRARRITRLLSAPGRIDHTLVDSDRDLWAHLPDRPQRAYDVRPLVADLVDAGGFEELQPRWAPNVVIGLGRLAGRTVGVVANNPLRKGGCLDSLGAEKAARFVRMCDSFGIPLVVVVDVPGYLPGVTQEWEGVVRRGAKLLYAFAEAVVPRVTLVTRKSYGGAYIAMNSRALGATAVFAWPQAELAVMGAEAAVKIIHRRRLAACPEADRPVLLADLVEEHRRIAGGVDRGLALGVVDQVIDPSRTREKLAEALDGASPGAAATETFPCSFLPAGIADVAFPV
jgi:acetyl-CoA/propionyl-CoA carboxylase carboxyl transferase subunit